MGKSRFCRSEAFELGGGFAALVAVVLSSEALSAAVGARDLGGAGVEADGLVIGACLGAHDRAVHYTATRVATGGVG